jgi:hypothetical protein
MPVAPLEGWTQWTCPPLGAGGRYTWGSILLSDLRFCGTYVRPYPPVGVDMSTLSTP